MESNKVEFYNNLNKVGNSKPNDLKVGDLVMIMSKWIRTGAEDHFEKSFNIKVVEIKPQPIFSKLVKWFITFENHLGKRFTLEFNKLGFHYENQDKKGLLTTIIIKQR